jgi:hypothetical protein
MFGQKCLVLVCILLGVVGCATQRNHSSKALIPTPAALNSLAFNTRIRDAYPASEDDPFIIDMKLVSRQQPIQVAVPPESRASEWFQVVPFEAYLPGKRHAPQKGDFPGSIFPFIEYDKIFWRASSYDSWELVYQRKQKIQPWASLELFYSPAPEELARRQREENQYRRKVKEPKYARGEWRLVAEALGVWNDKDDTILATKRVAAERIIRVPPQATKRRFDDVTTTINPGAWKPRQISPDEKENPLEFLEWRITQRPDLLGKWQRVPPDNSPNNPIYVEAIQSLWLRAVRQHPERLWPPNITQQVRWKNSVVTDDIGLGSTYFVSTRHYPDDVQDLVVEAEYGAKKKVYLRVVPQLSKQPADVWIQVYPADSPIYEIVAGTQNRNGEARFGVGVHGWLIERVRMRATFEDGSKAGEINEKGPADDTFYIKDRKQVVSLRAGKRTGKVLVWAESLDSQGRVKKKTQVVNIWFSPQAMPDVEGKPWKYVNGTFQREVKITMMSPRGRRGIGMPIEVRVKPVTSYPINPKASWVNPSRGRTDASGEFTTTQYWKPLPNASHDTQNYRVFARVLP